MSNRCIQNNSKRISVTDVVFDTFYKFGWKRAHDAHLIGNMPAGVKVVDAFLGLFVSTQVAHIRSEYTQV